MLPTKYLAIAVAAALLPLVSVSSNAQQAKQLTSGTTTITLDSKMVTALAGYGIAVTANSPATLSGSTATFPVVSGGIDFDTLVGVVYQSGGVTFTYAATDTVVTIAQLAIVNALPGQPAQMYGLVIVNNTVFGLYPLFDLDSKGKLTLSGAAATQSNISLTLTSNTTTLLNQAFGFDAFTASESIGIANVNATATSYNPISVHPGDAR